MNRLATIQENLTPAQELETLIQRCMQEDRLAQEILYKQHYGKMMSVCRRYFPNRDEALEVLNHGFLKVFRSLDQYRFDGPFEAWLYRIIYRTAIDYLRARMQRKKEETLEMDLPETGVDPEALYRLQQQDLLQLLAQLPETTRTVFNMFAIEGYKHAEIGTLLNISAGTSKWHVNQARLMLKSLIEKGGHHE